MKIKSLLFGLSVFMNGAFILLLIFASLSKTSRLSFYSLDGSYVSAAAVVSFPQGGKASFELVEITLKPQEKAYLQFSVVSEGRQGNLLITALYDPNVITVAETGYGLEITALAYGSSLIQTLTNEGIKDAALVIVE